MSSCPSLLPCHFPAFHVPSFPTGHLYDSLQSTTCTEWSNNHKLQQGAKHAMRRQVLPPTVLFKIMSSDLRGGESADAPAHMGRF